MSWSNDDQAVDGETIAAALGVKRSAFQERAASGRWPYREVPVRGGRKRVYPIATLPAEIGARVVMHLMHAHARGASAAPSNGLCAEPSGGRLSPATPPERAAPAATGVGGLGAAACAVASSSFLPVPASPAGLPAASAAGLSIPLGAAAAANDTRAAPGALEAAAAAVHHHRQTLWDWYARRPEGVRSEAQRRAARCREVRALLDAGMRARAALAEVARQSGVAESTLCRWWYGGGRLPGVAFAHPGDYAPLLAPRWEGAADSAEFDPVAWEWLKADWLRAEKPTARSCWRRLQRVAVQQRWVLPSYATGCRRLEALPWQVRVLARDGMEALLKRLPHVTRLRGHLQALQAVNADGHVLDLNVRLADGSVGRPVLVAWQDLMSGKLLAWRLGETLNQHLVRLSFGDLVEKFGIPENAYLDNGREFANKWMTGGAPTRFRFTIRDDDPLGIFTLLGIQVHWTTPYHGQSKPIERAWRDLCDNIARHPSAAGAYTGSSPVTKPHNHGERVLEWAELVKLVDEGIAEHNARDGRRTETTRGRSFDATFAAGLSRTAVRRATDEQRRLWLLAAEGVAVRETGHVAIAGNLYWGEDVAAMAGRKVVVRFDPDRLDAPVSVYTLGGELVGSAERSIARFDDMDAAKSHARANRQRLRAARDLLAAERRMGAIEASQLLAAAMPDGAGDEPAVAGATRLMPNRALGRATGTDDARPDAMAPSEHERLVRGAEALVLQMMEARGRRREPVEEL